MRHAFSVALVSDESSECVTTDSPFAMEARKNALWVWLFDGGGSTFPFISPLLNLIDVIVRTSSW